MKKVAATFFVILATAVGVQAAAITVTNIIQAGSYAALDNSSTPLPQGSGYVAIGTFTIDDAAIMSLGEQMDAAGLQAGFTQFSNSLTIGQQVPGFYQGQIDGPIAEGDPIAGAQLYTVIGSGSSITSSNSLIVYRHEGVQFQADPANTGDAALFPEADNVILGTPTTVTINNSEREGIQGVLIPEPSSALLGLVGLGFLAFRRRR